MGGETRNRPDGKFPSGRPGLGGSQRDRGVPLLLSFGPQDPAFEREAHDVAPVLEA